MQPVVTYGLPGLLVGTLVGFLSAGTLSATQESASPRQADERSHECAEIDYRRIAQACSARVDRPSASAPFHAQSTRHPGQGERRELTNEAKQALRTLDAMLDQSLERQEWSQQAGLHALGLLERVPEERAQEFEGVLRSAIAEGSVEVEPGAWVPGN